MIRNRDNVIWTLIFLVTTLGMLSGSAQVGPVHRMIQTPEYRVFEDGVTPRARVRVNYYQGTESNPWEASPGQISIEYGLPVWKPEYGKMFETLPVGKRWRLGSDYWTNLSSSFSMRIQGQQLEAGYYYMVLERTSAEAWSLVLLEPKEMTRLKLDPWHISIKDSGKGIPIPLEWADSKDIKERLEITLKIQDANPKRFGIHIRFGIYEFWTDPLLIDFE